MDLIDLEAMMIRSKRVHGLLRRKELSGLDALVFVVSPPKAVEEASIEVARQKGISAETRQLFAEPEKPRTRIVTIEELACS